MSLGVATFSNSLSPEDVQDSVPAWLLATQFRYGQGPRLLNPLKYKQDPHHSNHPESWDPKTPGCKQDVDHTSVASFDDDVSVSDSAHGSYSSESSSQTSWTSITESSDTFLDEDCKEQLLPLTKSKSHSAFESQEQILKGIQNNDVSESGSTCTPGSLETNFRTVKNRLSSYNPAAFGDRSQPPPQSGLRPRGGDTSHDLAGQHWSARRSVCSAWRQCPKLKRDTDVTEQFVALLIIFAKRLITSIWPLSDRPPMMTDCFNGAGVLPLEAFIRETLRRSKTSFSTLQVALYYLVLLKSRTNLGQAGARCSSEPPERAQCRAMQCGRRMFLSALMLASKYLQDRNYSARAWSKISGLRSNEINENEREYLAQINYDLHVPKEIFENWSKIVLALSKLSNESPSCRAGTLSADFGPPGSGSNMLLAAMVSPPGEDLDFDLYAFSESWWSTILGKLEPGIVKETTHVDFFLQTYLPSDQMHVLASLPHLSKQVNTPSSCNDLNFSETLRPRNSQGSKVHGVHTPQTPVQTSPAKSLVLPSRPQLGNLPTPQTTPRLPDQSSWDRPCSKPSLRCAASMDAMRSLRKQCLKNANLERCPPPRPQTFALPSMKYLMRSAETIQELPASTTTPFTSSPASVSSDSTATTASPCRSRSSSISSISSWPSSGPLISNMRKSVACGLSSPLSRICSLSDRDSKPVSADSRGTESELEEGTSYPSACRQSSVSELIDGSDLVTSQLQQTTSRPTSSEVAAIHGLMSLSTQSETPSQSVTPTPRRLSEKDDFTCSRNKDMSREHKRKLSKVEANLHLQVKELLSDGSWSVDVAEDHVLPYFGALHRQTQVSTSLRKENRRPISNPLNNKRLCSLQHSSSTPSAIPLSERSDSSILICR